MAYNAQSNSYRMPRFPEVMDSLVFSYLQTKKYHNAVTGLIHDSMPLRAKVNEAKRRGEELRLESHLKDYDLEDIVHKFYLVGFGFPPYIYDAIQALGTITETMTNFVRISAPSTEIENFPYFAIGRDRDPSPQSPETRPPDYGNASYDVEDLFSETQNITLKSDTEEDVQNAAAMSSVDDNKSLKKIATVSTTMPNFDQFVLEDYELPVAAEVVLKDDNEETTNDDGCRFANLQNQEGNPRTPGASIRDIDDDIEIMPLSNSGRSILEDCVGAVPSFSSDSLNLCVLEFDDGGPIRTPAYYGFNEDNDHRKEAMQQSQSVLEVVDLTPRPTPCGDNSDIAAKPTTRSKVEDTYGGAPESFSGKDSAVDTLMLKIKQDIELQMPESILEELVIPDIGSVLNELAENSKESTKRGTAVFPSAKKYQSDSQEPLSAADHPLTRQSAQTTKTEPISDVGSSILPQGKLEDGTISAISTTTTTKGATKEAVSTETTIDIDSSSCFAELAQEQGPSQQSQRVKPRKLVIQIKPTAISSSFESPFLQTASAKPLALADFKIPKKTQAEAFQKVVSIHKEVPAKNSETVEKKVLEAASSSFRARTLRFPQRSPYRGYSRSPIRDIKPTIAHTRSGERETRDQEFRSRSSRRGTDGDRDTRYHDRDHGYHSRAANSGRRSNRTPRNRSRSPPSRSHREGNSRRSRR